VQNNFTYAVRYVGVDQHWVADGRRLYAGEVKVRSLRVARARSTNTISVFDFLSFVRGVHQQVLLLANINNV
jgi:hypothetical protein